MFQLLMQWGFHKLGVTKTDRSLDRQTVIVMRGQERLRAEITAGITEITRQQVVRSTDLPEEQVEKLSAGIATTIVGSMRFSDIPAKGYEIGPVYLSPTTGQAPTPFENAVFGDLGDHDEQDITLVGMDSDEDDNPQR